MEIENVQEFDTPEHDEYALGMGNHKSSYHRINDPDEYFESLIADLDIEESEQELEEYNLEANIEVLPITKAPKLTTTDLDSLKAEGFNDRQLAVIQSDYPIVNIAGPGSGKTKTLIAKITTQVNSIPELRNTLILTFTNAAANEILERLSSKLDTKLERKDFYAGTFHGIFYKLMRENPKYLQKSFGFSQTPRILDSNEDKHLFEKVVQTYLNRDGKMKKTTLKEEFFDLHGMFPLDIYYTINNSINGIPESIKQIKAAVTERSHSENKKDLDKLEEIVHSFFKTKLLDNNMSFTDILMYTYFSLRDNEDMKKKIQEQFEYILVDEYQDTNPIQAAIIELIGNNNACLIGDPYQSIYRFLGASVKNIMKKTEIEDMNVIQLLKNYRSTPNIVDFTNDIASLFKERVSNHKPCESAAKGLSNMKIELKQNVHQEYNVLNSIQYRIRKKIPLSEMAILSRTKNDTYGMEKLLRINKIPFIKIGGNEFYETKEIKYLIDLAKIVAGIAVPQNIESVSVHFRGLGLSSMDKVNKAYIDRKNNNDTFIDIIKQEFKTSKSLQRFSEVLWGTVTQEEVGTNLFTAANGLEEGQILRDCSFKTFSEIIENENITFEDDLTRKADTINRKKEIESNIEYFLNEIEPIFRKGKEELIEFLSDISLKADITKDGEVLEAITITTAHSAKGKEWSDVYIINAEQGKFPSYRALDENLDEDERRDLIEEEKRLLYVAISRAKEKLMITSGGDLNNFIQPFINKPYMDVYTRSKPPYNG